MQKILKGASAPLVLTFALVCAEAAYAQDGFTINVGGRLHVDYAVADADEADFDLSASALRRGRIKGYGNFGEGLKYKIEFNTNSSGDINLEDAYIQWTPQNSPLSFKAGQFKTQNSLEEANSSLDAALIERAALTDTFQLDRRAGFEVSTKGDNYLVQLGAFGQNLEEIENNGNEGFAFAGRAVYKLDLADKNLVHFGASFRHRDQNDSDDLRYRQRPFVENTGRIISTGRIADSDTFFGGELAGQFGQAWASGEYVVVNANCSDDALVCTEDPSFDGFSIGGGYFFGGRRNYSVGKFKRPTIDNPVTKGGWGAVSINARFDTVDLTDSGIDGGDLDTFAVGANWWLHKNARIQFNYFNADATLSGPSVGPSLGLESVFAASVTDATFNDDSVSGFVTRLQFDF